MRKSAVVAGTGFEGRADIIRQHCKIGLEVILRREPDNPHDHNAIAVFLVVPKLFGLSNIEKQIGYVKANTAKSLSKKMDEGANVSAKVLSFYAPPRKDHPRVSIEVAYE